MGYNFVALLNGNSIESLDPNQSKYTEAMSEGTGNPNGPDHIESSSYRSCRSIHLAPGDYRVTLLTAGDSPQIIYEWAFRITHE